MSSTLKRHLLHFQVRKNSLNIKFLGRIFLGHPAPRRRDIPDKNFMQVAFFCCFRQGVAGMSRDLGRDVPDLEKLYARKLWADFSHPTFDTLRIAHWPGSYAHPAYYGEPCMCQHACAASLAEARGSVLFRIAKKGLWARHPCPLGLVSRGHCGREMPQ